MTLATYRGHRVSNKIARGKTTGQADTAFARDPGGALHLSVSNMHDNMEWGDPAETSMFTLGELSATG
jgi:hypothetical protein